MNTPTDYNYSISLFKKHSDNIAIKIFILILSVLFIIIIKNQLGSILTLISFDIIFSFYLFSLFQGKYRYLFILHPIFVLYSSYGFKIPYTEIGVAYSYLDTFYQYVDPYDLSIDIKSLFQNSLFAESGSFGFQKVFVGTIPIIWFPRLLFSDPTDISVYLSLSIFTLIYAVIPVSISTISPTFLEINSNLHRYGFMCFGLLLFIISYIGIFHMVIKHSRIFLLSIIMTISVVIIGVSRPPLLYSVLLFIGIDLFVNNKLVLFNIRSISKINKKLQIIIISIIITIFQYISSFIVPEKYLTGFSQQGGNYSQLTNVPVIGLITRVLYALLSPFPFTTFIQWELYGYNEIFLFIHFLSVYFSAWIVISLIYNIDLVINTNDDVRILVLFGVSILSSLAYSAIGFHVYFAPALPFLAVIITDRNNRVPFKYPFIFIIVMEVVSFIGRIAR